MELLIITAVQMFEKDIKQLLKKSGATAFSYIDVTGYKDQSDQPMEPNWFASAKGEYASILFYAFVQEEIVDEVTSAIDAFNVTQESESRVHVAVIDIKRTNLIK